jgi:hypothetical protein
VKAIDGFLVDLKNIETYVPMAVQLRVEGMQERHRAELSSKTNKNIPIKERNFNLQTVIKIDLLKHGDVIEELSIRAAKEYTIRRVIDKMYRDGRSLDYSFTLLKNTTDVYIIKNFEDCLNINDEHIGIATNL